jgi:hypothetical protein
MSWLQPLGARLERRAGHGHDLATSLGRQPGGDQRAGPWRSLDDDRSRAEPGDDPVTIREVARSRLDARRHFGDDQASLGHDLLPSLILRRIEDVETASDDADRTRLERSIMGRAVDAACETGNHDHTLLPEVVGQLAREAARRGGGVARHDHCHERPVEQLQVALDGQHRGASSSSASERG